MITLGVDLAADASRTAAVRIDWTRGAVTDAITPASDDAIIAATAGAAKIGIDCPFGWPDAFVDLVAAHRDGHAKVDAETIGGRKPLAYRATDVWCRAEHGLQPLSVSADRIAHAAFRCAGLLARIGEPDRSGAGLVAECYPAGSLHSWGLPHRRYKDDPAIMSASVEAIEQPTGLTFIDDTRSTCTTIDHAFDALVVALTASAAALDLVHEIPRDHSDVARREGWIVLPLPDALTRLV